MTDLREQQKKLRAILEAAEELCVAIAAMDPWEDIEIKGLDLGKLLPDLSGINLDALLPTGASQGVREAAVTKLSTRLAELDELCASAERRGPSHKGYVTDATYHHWQGERSALSEALRILADEETSQ